MNPAQLQPTATHAFGENGHVIEELPHPTQNGASDVPTEVLKVSSRSRPSAVAGAIAGVIRESGVAEVQSIGAGATNQAIKAVAIARSYLFEEGIDIVCVPSFIDVSIEEEERTAIRMLIERRTPATD
ncbi:MAG: stage V sporulation protein S [Chloroflexaceae bacterium]|nr:stage V sporulation protein S [Chloroflexaceae bacterium]NJL34467.1 stage V sporulation protein S [Chloroflexaceae bacterium]NJO07838.1 stage V sporulation protein S [Chloroflexaceae bacterium]